MPGETQPLTLTVDDDIREGGGRISMVSKLGEHTTVIVPNSGSTMVLRVTRRGYFIGAWSARCAAMAGVIN